MAQTTKKPAASKAAAQKKPPAKKTAVQPTVQESQTGRLIASVVCLFLSIFSFIGYFDIDAWFIVYFCGFIKGIIGWGYYLFPPALLAAACMLAFGKERCRTFKVISSLVVPIFLGALFHLFSKSADLEFTKTLVSSLYSSGKFMASGGVIAGVLAISLKSAVSIYGAFLVFLLCFLFFALNGVGLTIPKLLGYIRESRKQKKQQLQFEKAVVKEPYVGKNKRTAEPSNEPIQKGTARKRGRAIDIPVDEINTPDENYTEERVGFFNAKPRVKTPDQILAKDAPAKTDTEFRPAPLPTDKVKPLSVEEAAAVAGVPAAVVSQVTSETLKPAEASPTKKISHEEVEAETAEIAKTIEKTQTAEAGEYEYPPITLLRTQSGGSTPDGREEIALNRDRLESTIRSFGVSATITGVTRGPTVTRYDIELDQGVKLAKLTNLAGDLALALGVTSVRIAPIPDKISTVGIEVPNKIVSMVYLRDIIDSPSFRGAKSKLSFAIGKDIGGNAIVGNIAKLPHMLIAGTTGSGKSVCMNSLILSLLFKATPEEVRLIMIDPKMVELGIYNGIPHLYVPVVTDPKKAAGALQWSVVEMLKRYRLFSEVGVRDLAGYNEHQKAMGEQVLPRVVIVIDELADLMLVASKEVEESICRVAQMGRAAGMHLVIATQRPSADVITGLMKANIPSRIAFAVSSAMESRIIMDNTGAEKLVGQGDMLYAPLGAGKPVRIQGAFVSDEEREKVIDFVKDGAQVEYSEDILAQIEKAAEEKGSGSSSGADNGGNGQQGDSSNPFAGYDELLPQAVDVIFETKQASVSMLQRRLKLGYARAARIVDQMEEVGVVGPFEGSKPRQVLITKQQWQEMQTVQGTAPMDETPEQVSFSDYSDEPAEQWND